MPELLSYKFETEIKPQEGESNKRGDEDQQELPGFNSKTHVSEVITIDNESQTMYIMIL